MGHGNIYHHINRSTALYTCCTFHTDLWPLVGGDVSRLGSRLALLLEQSLPVLGQLERWLNDLLWGLIWSAG